MATLTAAARVDSWRATLAAFLADGTVTAPATTATATRRRTTTATATATATADDTAARHARWRATLAAHVGQDVTPEPPAETLTRTAAAFLAELVATVPPAPTGHTARRPTAAAKTIRRTPAPHVARDRCAAYWQAVQPRPAALTPTTGRPWLPTRAA